ncbi:MAG TPA: hypothetical protein VG101_20565 [Puia sp.]|nr:hypothetical protein [Puia sp.]
MAINQNHLFEELNGVKCAIVEKNVAAGRVEFLRGILEYNGYSVVVVASPPPKAAVAPADAGAGGVGAAGGAAPGVEAGAGGAAPAQPAPETFTVGVTDVMFNPINAIFGRLLKAPGGHVVTLAYWKQQQNESDNEKPYFA